MVAIPAPAAHGLGACATVRQSEDHPAHADGQQEHEADQARVGEDLDVQVLDAPFASLGGERLVDDVGKAPACVGEVRLEDLGARGALPADPEDRVVLPDADPDVREHRPLRVRLDAFGLALLRDPEEADELLERVGADRRHARRHDRDEREQGDEALGREPEPAARDERRGQRTDREPDGSGERAGHDEAERARDEGDCEQPRGGQPARAQEDPGDGEAGHDRARARRDRDDRGRTAAASPGSRRRRRPRRRTGRARRSSRRRTRGRTIPSTSARS